MAKTRFPLLGMIVKKVEQAMPTERITDRWTVCEKDHVHWGQNGAAGFLFRYVPREGEPRYLLQQRAKSVDFPGTWGIPGGAIREGESPEAAARREVLEEVGLIPAYRITGIEVQNCGGGWKFYVAKADVETQFEAFAVRETDATGWFTKTEMLNLSLHPELREWLEKYGRFGL
jgi:8-oxo-dGTP diphosphatase